VFYNELGTCLFKWLCILIQFRDVGKKISDKISLVNLRQIFILTKAISP